MRYPEPLIAPMREDLTQYGIEEVRTPADVDRAIAENGTVLMVVNSVCGCAAAKARPGVGQALKHSAVPDKVVTAFAGADLEAVARVRELAAGFPPSSPSMILFREGRPIYAMHRHEIEGRQAPEIAKLLTKAFDDFCVKHPR